MLITTGSAISAAGTDPYLLAEQVLSANAAEIDALADGFGIAAGQISECLQVSDSAALAAADAGVIADATPLELMTEVIETINTVSASPSRLLTIAAGLREAGC